VSRVVVIGAGHNGLTAAFYLARAGLKPLVLERRQTVGGAASTEEIAPGFRVPSLAHAIGPLRSSIVSDMRLESRGVTFIRPNPRLVALAASGGALVFAVDHARTAESIRRFSSRDADRYIDFCQTLGARVIVRGLRAATDFEYELQIAHANADLRPQIDTIFMPTRTKHGFVSASLVREIASHGGDVSRYAPAVVCEALTKKFAKK